MDRKTKILDGIDYPRRRGLEIGALAWPIVCKAEADIRFIDFMDAPGLRAKYASDPHVNGGQIVDVDYIWSGHAGLRAVLGEEPPFDYVLASHIVEHVPDLVSWLGELTSVLSDRGEIRLVVPDKRFTFDYLRQETVLADVVAAWLEKRRVSSPRAIVDMIVNFVELDRRAAWDSKAPAVERRPIESADTVVEMARSAVEDGVYHDVHSWVFTPKSFASVMSDLARLGLLCLECTCFHDTDEGEFEFVVGLRRTADVAAAVASWDAMARGSAAAPWERASLQAGAVQQGEYERLAAQLASARCEADLIRNSTSWRITEPLRRIKTALAGTAALDRGPRAVEARAPESAAAPEPAQTSAAAMAEHRPKRAPGTLLKASASRFGDRVFYCRRGRRHWVTDARWLAENGFVWPDDVAEVSPELLEAFLPGRLAPRTWTEAEWAAPSADSPGAMRELLVSRFRGQGYEIGAGASPLAIPLDCEVRYIDMYDATGLVEQSYEGQQVGDLMPPDIQANFDDLGELADEAADFIAACHVIEHTRSPIRSIFDAYRKLRPGGRIALVVPDMTRTFDRHRELTTLDHLIEDFHSPDGHRDALHFQEFYSRAFVTPPETYEQVWRQKWEERYPIHYHTWTHDSFASMIRYMSETLCRFDEVWSHPVLFHPDSNEFYFEMRKPA